MMIDNLVPDNKSPENSRARWVLLVISGASALLILLLIVFWANHHNSSKTSNSSTRVVRRDQQAGDLNIKFNQTATAGHLKVTVTKARITYYSDPNGVSEASAAPVNNQYLVADVTLQGTSKTPVNYDYNQFSLLSDTKTFAPLSISALPPGITTPLGSGALAIGQKISGQVVMPLPQHFKYYYIVFTPAQPSTQRVVAGP